MRLIITDRTKIVYSMYRAGEVSVHRACCERATQPYSLGGGGTIYPGPRPAEVTTRSPRMVADCLLALPMLIKMYYYFIVWACIYICTIVFTVSQFHADVYLVYLPGAVARSEACSLGMQAAPSSIPTSGTFFRGDLVMKTFLRPFSLFR